MWEFVTTISNIAYGRDFENHPVGSSFGASIDMLENAIQSCPDELWGDRARQPEFWYVAYHTLFFLDFYLA